jgi:HAMP domain-containing protein
MTARRRTLSWRVKLPLILILFAVGPLMLDSYRALVLMRDTFEARKLDSLSGLVTAKAKALEQFTDDRRTDVERIAQLVAPPFSEVLAAEVKAREAAAPAPERVDAPAPLPELEDAEKLKPEHVPAPPPAPEPKPPPEEPSGDKPTEQDRALADALLDLRHQIGLILWDQQQFEELLIIDSAGRVVASTFVAHEERTAKELAYFRGGLGATVVPPVFMSPITERLTMVIATPIRGPKLQVLGVLAARLNLTRFFSFINDITGLGETGETLVGRRVDDGILFMAPTRHDPDAALMRKIPLSSPQQSALLEGASGQSGQGSVTDYRGECTYAAWRHVPSLNWGLTVKQDCSEAMIPVEQARERMILWAVVLAFLALVGALVTAQALVRPLEQLKEATDRISKGDVNINLDIRSGDEIGDLADSFERMIAAIRFFREQSRQQDDDVADEETPSEPAPE